MEKKCKTREEIFSRNGRYFRRLVRKEVRLRGNGPLKGKGQEMEESTWVFIRESQRNSEETSIL